MEMLKQSSYRNVDYVAYFSWAISFIFSGVYIYFSYNYTWESFFSVVTNFFCATIIIIGSSNLSKKFYSSNFNLYISASNFLGIIITLLLVFSTFFFCSPTVFIIHIIGGYLIFDNIRSILLLKINYKKFLAFIFLVVVFSGLIWQSSYQIIRSFPDGVETLLLGYHISPDNVYYASMAGILKLHFPYNSGVLGVQYQNFYWGASLIIAGFSKLCNTTTLNTLPLIFPIIIIPLLIKTILNCLLQILNLNLRTVPFFLLFLCITSIGIYFINAPTIPIVAESISQCTYSLGLTTLLVLFSLIMTVIEKQVFIKNVTANEIFIFCSLPLLIGLIGITKTPLIFTAMLGIFLTLLYFKLYKPYILFSYMVCIIISVMSYHFFWPKFYAHPHVELFEIIYTYVNHFCFWLFFEFLFAYLSVLSGILYMVLYYRKNNDFLKTLRTSWIGVSLFLIFTLSLLLPAFLIVIPNGSGDYFIDQYRLITIFFFIYIISKCYQILIARQVSH